MPFEPVSAVDAAARCLVDASYVIALTGAGLSVESGIPPFRGPGGLWTKYGEPPMNGFERFLADPQRAWQERLDPQGPMRELFQALAAARPNLGHFAFAELERLGVLRATISQNIDDLHRQAGSKRLLEIHGNATLVRCLECVARYAREEIDTSRLPPECPRCGGLLKSDVVSFGEPIPVDVLSECERESALADCVLVAGTSATVYPAAGFALDVLERGGTLVEINPHETELTPVCRVSLRAPSGDVLPRIAAKVAEWNGVER